MAKMISNTDEDFDELLNISIKELMQLGSDITDIICRKLNAPKVIPTDSRLSRDWRGLAVLLRFSTEEMTSLISQSNCTLGLLKRWSERERCTVKYFFELLEKLDRFDIIDDTTCLLRTCNRSVSKLSDTFNTQQYVLSPKDREAISKGLPLINYDAFILYANEDVDFATELIKKMEEEFVPRLQIFAKDRDLLVGAMDYSATIQLIAERCNRLIVVLSPAFVASPENKFFISFAQSIGIDQRRRKIIPCIYTACEIPTELKPLHKLDYGRPVSPLYNFWDKLHKSISAPITDSSVTLSSGYNTLSNGFSNLSIRPHPNVTSLDVSKPSSIEELSDRSTSPSIVDLEADIILPVKSEENTSTELTKSTKKKSKKFPWGIIKSLPQSFKEHRKKKKVPTSA